MTDTGHVAEPKNFAPKTPVDLNPPKDDPISPEELSKCDGKNAKTKLYTTFLLLVFLHSPLKKEKKMK